MASEHTNLLGHVQLASDAHALPLSDEDTDFTSGRLTKIARLASQQTSCPRPEREPGMIANLPSQFLGSVQ